MLFQASDKENIKPYYLVCQKALTEERTNLTVVATSEILGATNITFQVQVAKNNVSQMVTRRIRKVCQCPIERIIGL